MFQGIWGAELKEEVENELDSSQPTP
jgi:hypothetical protein